MAPSTRSLTPAAILVALAFVPSLAAQAPEPPEPEDDQRTHCIRFHPAPLERLQLDREELAASRERMREEMERLEVRLPTVIRPLLASVLQRGRFGLEITDLNEDLGTYFGRTSGALVLGVRDGAAFELRGGDVIVAIGGREVDEVTRARELLSTYRSGEAVVLTVWREGAEVTVEGIAP